jgi:aminomethyltransferase
MSSLIKTKLYDLHKTNGAKLVPFANHELPLWFSSAKDEHLAVRNNVGMFDISHMGVFEITGANSMAFLQHLSCNTLVKAQHSTMVYSMFLNHEGMILDDVMLGCYDSTWILVVNGSNKEKLAQWLATHKPDTVTIKDLNQNHTFIAVQGPKAISKLASCVDSNIESLPRFGMTKTSWKEAPLLVTRTGYTGEDGCELLIPNESAPLLWQNLLDLDVTPCGLASRDTLRIEAGLPLYGQELSESIHPFMTRYPWVVKTDHDFIGKEALLALKETTTHVAVGLELSQSLIARTNYSIEEGGYISSGTLLPTSQKSIALAMVPKEYSDLGSNVHVNIRHHQVSATVTPVPFT